MINPTRLAVILMSKWATDFYEIQNAVGENLDIQNRVVELVNNEPIHGKAVEGGNRVETLRSILIRFFEGRLDLDEAVGKVSSELPRHESRHAKDNRVFPTGWDERLLRTQVSRFYNQAVLRTLKEQGEQDCYVPHSSAEDPDTPCTIELAGSTVETDVLLSRLERTYGEADYHDEVKVPNHPHCTHTIVPVSEV